MSLTLAPLHVLLGSEPSTAQHQFIENERESYARGEVPKWSFFAAPGEEVVFSINGLVTSTVVADKKGVAAWSFDTTSLKAGAYQLTARWGKYGKDGEAVTRFNVGPAYDPGAFPFYRWGHVTETMDMDWYRARGFTGGTISAMTNPEPAGSAAHSARKRLLDKAVREGFTIGFYLHPLWSKELSQKDEARVLGRSGVRQAAESAWPVDPLTFEAREHAAKVTDSFLKEYASHPAIHYVMLSSEQRTLPGVGEEVLKLAKKELPFDFSEVLDPKVLRFRQIPAEKLGRGVVADNDPDYLGRKWFHERGHGTSIVNLEIAEKIRAVRPELQFSHEPWRNAPTRDVAKGLDLVGSWTYSYSDLKRLMFGEFLRAPGRTEGQKVQAILTLYVYANMVMPLKTSTADLALDSSKGDIFFNASPDYVREALWIYLSQRPDEFSLYWSSLLPPEKTTLDPHLSAPEAFDVIGEFNERILKPYGPAILASKPVKSKVALLVSSAASWFTTRDLGYNINEACLPYATLLVSNNVPFEVLLDDDVVEGGLKDYEALVIPLGETLTESMVAQINIFMERGGVVIANGECPLKGAAHQTTQFDFEPLQRQTGSPIPNGKARVTADEARTMMEGYAKTLAPLVEPYRGEARADSPRVIINSLDAGEARYHFIINDERVYGPRFGEYKLHFENGKRQQAQVTFDTSRYPVLYDLTTKALLAGTAQEDGKSLLTSLWLPAAGGKIILALPEPVGSVRLFAPGEIVAGKRELLRLSLVGQSGKPMKHAHPVHLRITDGKGAETGWSRTLVMTGGVAEVSFVPAWNDAPGQWRIEVTDLVTNEKTTAQPLLRR